jgi:hypothetical protein
VSRVALALVLLLASGTPALAQAPAGGFSLRPANPDPAVPASQAYFVHTVAAGAARGDEVLAINAGDQPTALDLYAVDALTGATTGAVYANRDTPPTGAGTWLRLPESRVTVPPRSTARVPFDLTVPAGTPPGQYLAGLVAQPAAAPGTAPTAALAPETGQFTVTTTTRVVVAVAVTVPGELRRRISVTGVRASTGATGTQLTVGVRNDGNVLVRPQGTLLLRDQAGAERVRLRLDMDTILPGGTAGYAVAWPRELPAGQYGAEVALETTDALAAAAPTHAPGRADFRSGPIEVRVVAADLPTVQPGRSVSVPAPAQPDQRTATAGPPWLPVAVAGLALLLLANLAAVLVARRRRERDDAPASVGAAPSAPPAAYGAAPPEGPAPAAPAPGRSRDRRTAEAAPVFVKGRGRTIYLLEDGVRRPFASWAAFVARGGSPTLANVRLLPDDALASYPEGAPIEDGSTPP